MRAALYSSAALLIAFSPLQARAAEVSEAGAKEILGKLTYYLPKSVVDTGFLKVTAGTKRYELSIDFLPFLRDFKPQEFSINGLRPLVQYLTPQDDGTWLIEGSDNVDVSGFFLAEGKKTNYAYKIDKWTYDAVIDPALSFVRSANTSIEKLSVTADGGPSNVQLSMDSYTSDSRTENVTNGVADLVSNFSGRGFSEVITDPTSGPVAITAGSLDGRAQIDKLSLTALRDLVVFALEKAKSDAATLTADESTQLKALLKANIPFAQNLTADNHFRDVKVTAQGMQLGLSDVGYKFDFNGIKQDSRVGVEFSFADPSVPPGLLPPGTEEAMPKSLTLGVAVAGLNLEGVVSYMATNADFTKAEPLTQQQSDELGKIVLPDGKVHIEFNNVAAKSDVYDVTLRGTMLVAPENSDKPEADITITARDLDKTVNYLQANASKVPQYGQASFGLLMMKGFGKQEPDGSMTWNVKLDQAGKVMINGREMPQ